MRIGGWTYVDDSGGEVKLLSKSTCQLLLDDRRSRVWLTSRMPIVISVDR